jgi:ATP-dependent Clp protease ATP-binding subunit ClpB
MEFEKYTDRAKGFLQSAQTLALRRGHQRLTPEHLLKVLLEDPEGLCANLIRAAGGDPKAALTTVDGELERLLFTLAAAAGTGAAKAIAAARVNARSLNRAIEEVRKGRKADSATAEEGYDALHTEAEAERHAAE